jgi:cytochrome c peroxidase
MELTMKSEKSRLGAGLVVVSVAMLYSFGAAAGPPAAELTPIEALGKQIFFDKISEPSKSMSCASCHAPKAGWTGAIAGPNLHGAVYRGADPRRFGNRKPPTSSYAVYSPIFHMDPATEEFFGGNFWDGRATGSRLALPFGSPTAEQALGPHLNPVEQNMASKQAVCAHVAASKYAKLFEEVWGKGSLDCSDSGVNLTYDRFGISMAAYQGSVEVSPFSSRFDVYWQSCLGYGNTEEACGLAEGEQATLDPDGILTAQEFDGLIEFGEYCSACHVSHESGPGGVPPLFSDNSFHNIGVPKNPDNPFYKMDKVYLDNGSPINPAGADWIDLGLGGFLRTTMWSDKAEENDGKFRVPTTRNVDMRPGKGFTKAYMHNGALKSLEEVVHFYNTRDVPEAGWAPPEVDRNVNRDILEGVPLGNFELDAEAEAAIVAFLKTLTDGYKDGSKR